MTDPVPPRVSVCMPVYNGADYIAESIDSVLAQTYTDFRLIVCDNCSQDDTEAIVRSFRDPRLIYVRNSRNLGPVGNANRCLELAVGEYVYIFHHDDVMLPDNLKQKVALLDDNPNLGFVHSNLILIDSQGKIIAEDMWNEDTRRDYREDGLALFHKFLLYLPLGCSIFIGAVLARKKCYDHLGGFNPDLIHCNDSEMWMRMLLFYDAACIGKPLVKYRVHPASASSGFGDYTSLHYLREHLAAVRIIFDTYRDHIPQADDLKQKTSLAFGEQALKWANRDLSAGDFVSGRTLFKEALNISPEIIRSVLFWKAAARFAAGPAGLRLSRVIRKQLIRHDR